jgi:hypothetical protein
MKEIVSKPLFLKRYFWNVDFAKLDMQKQRHCVITQILNYGDEKAIEWLNKNFTKDEQKEVLCSSRNISLRSANFWALILGVAKDRVKCLQKHYLRKRKQLWPY